MSVQKEKINLTEEKLKEYLKDIFLTENTTPDKEFFFYVTGYEDENGKIHCKALEEFDKAMKEELNKEINNKLNNNGVVK